MSVTTAKTHATEVRTPRWAIAAAAVAVTVLVLALVFGGGMPEVVPGIPDPGLLTYWGLPLAVLISQAAAVVTVGFVLLAVMLPAQRDDLGRDALGALRLASTSAVVWTIAAMVVHVLRLSDLSGLPLPTAVGGRALATFTLSIEVGQAGALVVLMTAVLAIAARLTVGHGGAVALLLLALVALVPPALTGHSSTGDFHHSASISLTVHVVAVSLWVGGLVALLTYAGGGAAFRRANALPRVAQRFSHIALIASVAVLASGALNAYVRLGSPADLVTTRYGWVLTAKLILSGVLVYCGHLHRVRTLPALEAGRRDAFVRLAGVEVLVMAAAVALGVALSRTSTPAVVDAARSLSRDLLGFIPPPAPSLSRIFTETYPDAVFTLGCLAAALWYGAGVIRLRRRGDKWPVGRTVAWYLGLATVLFATTSGLMTYGMLSLSWHMTQHMVLAMVSPMLLVMGAPVTLALRALHPAARGQSGPREWLLTALQSRVTRVLTNPLVVFVLLVSAPFIIYLTGLFEYAMRNHNAHTLMELHFLVVGYLFADVLIGTDPLPSRPPYIARIIMLFASMVFHAFFGVALMSSANIVAYEWYATLAADIPWLGDAALSQRTAGQIAWGFGELPALAMVLTLVVQWSRSDSRDAKRADKHGQPELDQYNDYLASLNRRGAQR